MVDINKVIPKLGSWSNAFSPFLNTDEFQGIYRQLKDRSRKGAKILPNSALTYKSFELCDYSKVKAVICMQDPFFTIKNGIEIADGIPMSCINTKSPQPSLVHWHKGVESSECQGFNINMDIGPDISYLLTEEHILLINSSLTVEENKPSSHSDIWKPFMKYLFDEILNNYFSGLPIVLCGKQAHQYEKYINPLTHWVLKVEHMAAASYNERNWDYNNLFKWCNEIIKNSNGEEAMIKWYREMK